MFNRKLLKRYVNRLSLFTAVFLITVSAFAADPPKSPFGADAVPDIYAPNLAGPGGFTTTTGGAPASALNPAQGGTARRMIFDAGYLAIPSFKDGGFMQSLEAGALFPTRYGVFGGSARYIGGFENDQFESFPINPTFGGNVFASKEVYPGMSLGAGLNFGVGADWTISGDLGIHYNIGKLGALDNFTWAFVFRSLGKSYFPTWLTAAGGVSFDFIHVEGKEGKPSPFSAGAAVDLVFPSLFYPDYINMIIKAGLNMKIAEVVNLTLSWPGASGLNMRELSDGNDLEFLPSVGLGFNIILPSGGERIAGGRLPSDGDLKIDGAFKPLYNGVTAIGGGVSWYAGIADKKPPVIDADYPETMHFSPNHDGSIDYLEFPVSITDDHYVVSWKMDIKDSEDNVIRTIENKEPRFTSFSFKDFFKRLTSPKKHIDIPSTLVWDGIKSSGEAAGDGKYFFVLTATDDSGNTSESVVYETVLRNTPPTITIDELTSAMKIFNPKGVNEKNTVTIVPRGSDEEAWESGIWNAADEKIRAFDKESGRPAARVWDGKDDAGQVAPDGIYSYRISVKDRAGNSASASMSNIILDAREAGAFLTSSVSAIAPKNAQQNLVVFSVRLLLQDGVDNWKLELIDETGSVQRAFSGGSSVPATMNWNGYTADNAVKEGLYTPTLTVAYTKGDVVKTQSTTVRVDISGPELSLTRTPDYFSPDNDGEEDELLINLVAKDASPIASWTLEIKEPEPPYPVFRRIEGRGSPAGRMTWDGKSDKGELVQSATDYPYTFRAADVLGNSSSIDGKIGVDVLVIRDGDRLKIMIPSIQFRPNFADFVGLPGETVDNNNRIIRRIAQILNKFREYKVIVEGHANPVSPPGPERDRQEASLKQISEARAKAVVDSLVGFGVARSRLTAVGVGGLRPVVKFEDNANWWKNRRVEFYLVK